MAGDIDYVAFLDGDVFPLQPPVKRVPSVADYEILLDALADAVWVKDAAGQYLSVNATTAEWLGKSRAQLLSEVPESYAPSDLVRRWAIEDEMVMRTGVPLKVEERIPDGDRLRYIETVKVPLRDPVGDVIGTAGSARDITVHRLAEERLRLLSLGVSCSPVGVLICDADGIVRYANELAARLVGSTTTMLEGAHVLALPWWTPDSPVSRLLARALDSQDDMDETVDLSAAGATLTFRIRVVTAQHADASPVYQLITLEDVSSRVQMERRLHEAERLEAVGQLAGGIAHDFRNILTAIAGFADILRYGAGDRNELRECTSEILNAVDRANALAGQLLIFSRQHAIPTFNVSPSRVIERNAGMLRALIGPGITLTIDLDARDLLLKADEVRFEQILVNLVVNARDALAGRPRGHVQLALRGDSSGHQMTLVVEDNGVGIAADALARVFEPFFTTKAIGKGNGMGLAIVYGIVKQLGGDISISSVPDTGTRVEIVLPVSEATHLQVTAEQAAAPSAAVRVIVIDDDVSVRAVLRRVFEGEGFCVTAVDGATLSLADVDALPAEVDLLVTDVTMPEVSGFAVADRMRQRHPELPIILISGFATDSPLAFETDARTRFLEKPLRVAALLQTANELLNGVGEPAR